MAKESKNIKDLIEYSEGGVLSKVISKNNKTDVDIEMLPGVIIFMKKNAVHSLKAEENTSFLLMLVK